MQKETIIQTLRSAGLRPSLKREGDTWVISAKAGRIPCSELIAMFAEDGFFIFGNGEVYQLDEFVSGYYCITLEDFHENIQADLELEGNALIVFPHPGHWPVKAPEYRTALLQTKSFREQAEAIPGCVVMDIFFDATDFTCYIAEP